MTDNTKVIAVTGASRGIGAAITRELARRGHTVGCLTRKGVGIEEGETDTALAERLIPIACDVTDPEQGAKALEELTTRAGRLDGLVNNAGLHMEGRSTEFPVNDFARVLQVNATGVFALCQNAHPLLKAAGGGLIVNIGSHYDKMGVKYTAAYCASKAAVGALTRCLAVEWARDGIRVIDVAPGFVLTDLNREHMKDERVRSFIERAIPSRKVGEPAEIARFIAAAYGEDIPFMTGETYYLDGAQAIANI